MPKQLIKLCSEETLFQIDRQKTEIISMKEFIKYMDTNFFPNNFSRFVLTLQVMFYSLLN